MTKKLNGLAVTAVIAIVPCFFIFAFSQQQLSQLSILDLVARLSAVAGMSLLSFNIILSARLGLFERLFGGLDRAYRAHRLIGGSVLILFLIHSATITAKYSSISLLSGYEFLKPNTDVALMLGKIALGIMLFAVCISMYIKIKYQWFITLQRILGAVIFIAGYHALFVSGSDVRSNVPLFTYLATLSLFASGLYVYRSLFHRSIKSKLRYKISSIWHDQQITVLWMQPETKPLSFYAGQFAFFQFGSAAVDGESHPFSMSSSSDDHSLRIAMKESGDFTADVKNVAVGDLVEIEGPYGQFSFTKVRSTKQVWVAGGIGITPFLSMAQSLPSGYDVTLYYCVRTKKQAIFLDELKKISEGNSSLNIKLICSDDGQIVTAHKLVEHKAQDYLLCAPPAMMHDLESQLSSLGVSKNNIHYEDFALK